MTFRGTGVQGYAKGKALVAAPGSPELADLPEGGVILVVEDLSLEDSAAIDFSKVAGIVAERGDASSSVCVIARGVGIPAVTGIAGCREAIVTGDRLLIRRHDVVVNPDLETVNAFEAERGSAEPQLTLDL